MTIREVTCNDISSISLIEQECFSVPWTAEQLSVQLKDGYMFLLAEAEGNIMAYVGLQYVLDEGYISNVATAPAFRRRGAADAVLDELEKRAMEKSLAFITLEVRKSNAPAIALYEKHGYTLRGERKNYYEKPTENALIYTKDLIC